MSDEETKGRLKTIADALTRPGTQHNNLAEFENLKTELAAEKAKTRIREPPAGTRDAQAAETAKKDAAWERHEGKPPGGLARCEGDRDAQNTRPTRARSP